MRFWPQVIMLFLACNFFIPTNANSSNDIDEVPKYDTDEYNEYFESVRSDYENADDELNAIYKEIIAYYQQKDYSNNLNLLRKAQNDWIKFRDSWCEFETSDFILVTGELKCLTLMTETQTQTLRDTLDGIRN